MSRKDYELIAAAIKEAHGRFDDMGSRNAIAVTASVIAGALRDTNPRFIAATGTNEGSSK